jgi:hypothetical protein
MRRRLIITAALSLGAGASLATGLHGASGKPRQTPLITPAALKDRLVATRLHLVFRPARAKPGVLGVLAGTATAGQSRVGFEFALTRARAAETTALVTVALPERADPFAIEKKHPTRLDPVVRGILGNIAYANFFSPNGGGAADMAIVKKLDDALFGAFPPDDPLAHSLLRRPPG